MTVAQHNWRRLGGQVAAGAITGAAATAGVLFLLEGRGLDTSDGGQMLAIVAGMIYALVGLIIGLGILSPNVAWKLLNVEDADELREERPRLWPSALASFLIGLFLLTLASAPGPGEAGLISNEAAAVVAAACLIGAFFLTLWTSSRTDELIRLISAEASATALQLIFVAVGAWAALAQLGFVEWMSPLALVAGLAMVQLVAVIAVCGRRGLLAPRG